MKDAKIRAVEQSDRLREAIIECLYAVKAHTLPRVCSELGLQEGSEAEAMSSKTKYVRNRIDGWSTSAIQSLAARMLSKESNFELEEALALTRPGAVQISEITRRSIIDLLTLSPLEGKLHLIEFLERIWPLQKMRPSTAFAFDTARDEIWQHVVRNDDWSTDYLLVRVLNLLGISDALLGRFLSELLHPVVRDSDQQRDLAEELNRLLKVDGFILVKSGEVSGRALFSLTTIMAGVNGRPKNVIFASTGLKPEMVLRDAINNDIEIVKHAELCLVYDRDIGSDGLRWSELLDWWTDLSNDRSNPARSLYHRLKASLSSPPEIALFKHYYKTVAKERLDTLPALLPQVYLHLDPLTLKQRGGTPRLVRQRMDFLLLPSDRTRIVIEVDGVQHYADSDGKASTTRYAEMAAADRELKLSGYHVYRFGGGELMTEKANGKLDKFWSSLFQQHHL